MIPSPDKSERPTYEELVSENNQLREENAQLRSRVTELEAVVKELRVQVEALSRSKKRQAAPFSKGKPKKRPKRPGRKKGHSASHRSIPEVIDHIEEVPLPFHTCPDCGENIEVIDVQSQHQTDLPPIRPVTTRFDIEVGECLGCGRRVQGRHKDQISDALGKASVQIGPQALAMGCQMKHLLGLSYGKIHTFFQSFFGFPISRSTFSRADTRLSGLFEPTYGQLILSIREKEAVNVDETGWRISGQGAWLWVFTHTELTVYHIDPTRANGVVRQILGEDFQGTLGCDCFLCYNPLPYDQQKCVAHLLRNAKDIEQIKTKGAVRFSRTVQKLLKAGIALKKRNDQMTPHGYAIARGRLEKAMDRLLLGNFTDKDNARFAKRLNKHRHRLFRFLYIDAVEPTNNAAERALRPAVISRKLSAGNRSEQGAKNHSILASVIQTCRQKGENFCDWAKKLLCDPSPKIPPWALEGRPQPP